MGESPTDVNGTKCANLAAFAITTIVASRAYNQGVWDCWQLPLQAEQNAVLPEDLPQVDSRPRFQVRITPHPFLPDLIPTTSSSKASSWLLLFCHQPVNRFVR